MDTVRLSLDAEELRKKLLQMRDGGILTDVTMDTVRLSLDVEELRRKLLQMRDGGVLTDVTLVYNNTQMAVHQCVLANSSLFFKLMFTEGSYTGDMLTLNMDQLGVSCVHLDTVIDYMYTGSVCLSTQLYGDVVQLADELVIPDLLDLAYTYLSDVVTWDACLNLYLSLYSRDLHLDISKEILTCVWNRVQDIFYHHIIIQESFLQLPVDDLSHLLCKGIRQNFSLINMLRFLVTWLQSGREQHTTQIAEQVINLCVEVMKEQGMTEGDIGQIYMSLQDILSVVKQGLDTDSIIVDNIIKMISQLETMENQIQHNTSGNSEDMKNVEDTSVQESVTESLSGTADVSPLESTPEQPTLEDVNIKKTTKSLSSTVDKIKVKVLEKSIQERVSRFLDGQLMYTRIRQRVFNDEFVMASPDLPGGIEGQDGVVDTEHTVDNTNTNNNKTGTSKRKKSAVLKSLSGKKRRKPTKLEYDDEADANLADNIADNPDHVVVKLERSFGDHVDNATVGCSDEPYSKINMDDLLQQHSLFFQDDIINKDGSSPTSSAKKNKRSHIKRAIVNFDLLDELKELNLTDFRCCLCASVFKRGYHLMRHLKRIHANTDLGCPTCSENFTDPKLFISHMRGHLTDVEERLTDTTQTDGQTHYTCRLCLSVFTQVSSIRSHLVQHRSQYCKPEVPPQSVDEQSEQNGQPATLENGQSATTAGGNTTKPEDKGKAFKLRIKKPYVRVPGIHQCHICPSVFKRKDHLSRHILCVHTDDYPYTCETCGKKFKIKYKYQDHLLRHDKPADNTGDITGQEEKSVLCYICGATLKSQVHLKRHLYRHRINDKRHTCTICNKTYCQAITLKVHMRSHTGVRPYQCEICSMMFAVKSNMLRHQRRHRGEKRYECDQCGKRFLMVGDLKRHYTTHTGEKNFECQYCGKRFNVKSKVRQHERIHTGEKPHACRYCGKRFIQSGDKKRHEATHSNHREEKKRKPTLYEIANPCDTGEGQSYTNRVDVDTTSNVIWSNNSYIDNIIKATTSELIKNDNDMKTIDTSAMNSSIPVNYETVHSTPVGTVHSSPPGTIHSSPPGTVHSSPPGTIHSSPPGTVHSSPEGTIHSTSVGTIHSTPPGIIHSAPMGTGMFGLPIPGQAGVSNLPHMDGRTDPPKLMFMRHYDMQEYIEQATAVNFIHN